MLPVTLAFRSFSFSVAFRASRALALPASSNFTNLPSESTRPKPLFEQPMAHFLVCPARSLSLRLTSTSVHHQVRISGWCILRDTNIQLIQANCSGCKTRELNLCRLPADLYPSSRAAKLAPVHRFAPNLPELRSNLLDTHVCRECGSHTGH